MTLAPGREYDWVEPTHDRRGRAVEPRRSWASARPFELRATPFNHPNLASDRWSRAAVRYRGVTLTLDIIWTTVVSAAFVFMVVGPQLKSIGLVVLATISFVSSIAANRGYLERSLGDDPVEYQAVLHASMLGVVVLMAVEFSTGADISRIFVFLGLPTLASLCCLSRVVHRWLLRRERVVHGKAMRSTLVIGEFTSVEHLIVQLQKNPGDGYRINGICVPALDVVLPKLAVPVLGAIADVPQVVVDHGIEVVVIADRCLSGGALRRLSWALGRAGVHLVVAPDLVEVNSPRLAIRPVAGLALLEVELDAPRRRLVAKAILDRIFGLVLLVLASPVILGSALVVRLTSSGSPFYFQSRVGVDGRMFTMWKIRSMYSDSGARRAALQSENNGSGLLFKMRKDPRITPVGRFLRRYSFDELPQLVNVVRGEMSLVGPRPPLLEEVSEYADAVQRRLRVKPGLTGLWQTTGRSDLSWEESIRLDLRYVDNWSIAMDILILWRTVRAVLRPSGAY